LEVVGEPSLEFREGKQIVVVKLRINKNTRAHTIEEMIGKRKQFIVEMMDELERESRLDFKILDLRLPEQIVDNSIQKLKSKKETLLSKEAAWFNNTNNFQEAIKDAFDYKLKSFTQALHDWKGSSEFDHTKVSLNAMSTALKSKCIP
jgi:hypothetical protein